MINKYSFVKVTSALRIISLLLVLILAPLSGNNYIQGAMRSQVSTSDTDPTKGSSIIINPGLDPMVSLSSNSVSLSAAANSTGEVNVTSNISWTATIDPADTWLAVNPVSATGNGTLTFTAQANTSKVNPRTAYVLIHATGVADQTIMVTQSQEKPAITFSSSVTNGSLSINLQFLLGGTFYIDWGNSVQVAQSANTLGQTYSTTTYKKGDIVKVYASGITNLKAGSSNLTSMVVAESPNLLELHLDHNNLTSLDISRNTNLTWLDCSYNDLTSLDITQNAQLYNLSLGYNNVSALDLSRNSKLGIVSCISNNLSSLDVTNNPTLTTLHCYLNKLTSLDVSRNLMLKLIYCYSNNLAYNNLPQQKSTYTSYSYAPQARIPASVIGNKVDVSSQLTAVDMSGSIKTTVYTWYTKTNGATLIPGTDYTESNGVFTFLKNQPDSVFCTMTNAAFPLFTGGDVLRTQNLKVVLLPPVVVSTSITAAEVTTATGNGSITALGIPDPTQYGFVWSTTIHPTVELSSKTLQGAISAVGPFVSSLTGLAPGTTYFARAYATNLAGTGYGTEITFTTKGLLPIVTTLAVNPIGTTVATGNGNITSLGVPDPTEYGIVWSTSLNPTILLSTKTTRVTNFVTGPFTGSLTGLISSTLYHVRAYATNAMGTAYGDDMTFTTASPVINVPTPITLTGFSTFVGTASTPKTFSVGGALEGDLIVTAPAGYEVRESGTNNAFGNTVTFSPVSGVVTLKVVDVRITALASIGAVAGTITCTSAKAVEKTVSVTGTVLAIPLTIADPVINPSKIYDGTTLKTFTPGALSGIVPGDIVDLNMATTTATYDTPTVGSGKTITVTYTLQGAQAYKYLAPANYIISTGVISQLPINVTAVTDTKTYDGNTSSVGVPTVVSLLPGDAAITPAIQVYDNAGYGTTHVLTASGLTIKNGSGVNVTNNYAINYVPSPATGIINKLAVTVTAVTATKTYDGNTSSDGVPTVMSLLTGDAALTPAFQVYDNAGYGTTHVLTASGLTIKNSSGVNVTNNYTINYIASPATGVINKLVVTVTAVTATKTYDGNTSSDGVPTVVSLLAGDAALTPAFQVYDNADYGTTHVLTASGLSIKNGSGANVTNNYTINYVPSPATGVINKLVVTVTAVTATKTYDGNTSSDGLPTVVSLLAGDAALTPAFQVYDNADYGTTHILTASGLTIKNGSGANVTNNYAINYVSSPANGVINKLTVTVTAVTDSKTYDGNTVSTGIPTIVSLLAGDAALTPAFQVYDNAGYGTTHVLTASGLTIKNGSGTNVTNNYTINYVPSPATGVISKLVVTVTAVTATKTYDGNTSSDGNPTVLTLATGDAALTPAYQVYDNADYGTTHVLTASGLTIKNSSGVNVTNNYTINYIASPATGVINKVVVTVTAVTATKTYDGNTSSDGVPTVVSLLAGDAALTPAFQVYDNADYGTTHVLTASGLTIKNGSGTNVTNNYTINYVSSPATGVINRLAVTVTAVTDSKTYDGNTGSTGVPTVVSLLAGDVALTPAIQTFDNANFGVNHILIASGLTIKNAGGTNVTNNYAINYVPSPATGVINKLAITVTAVTATKTYDGNTGSDGNPTVLTLATGDAALTPAFQVYDNAGYGTTHVLTASGLTIKNSIGTNVTNNYTINYVPSPATGVINKLVVTVTAVTDTKAYDGNTSSIVNPTVLTLASGDEALTPAFQVYDNADYGTTHVLTASGLTIKNGSGSNVTNNYTINYVPSPATGVINKLVVTVTAVTTTKTYDGNTSSDGVPTVVSLLAGDAAITPAIQVYDNADYGTTHVLIASGLTIKNGIGTNVTNNYTINYVSSPATGVINRLAVTVTAVTDSKTYDGNTGSTGVPTVVSLLAGDAALTPAIQSFDNANFGVNHILIASGLTIKNAGGTNVTNNYAINYVPSPATGVINKLAITVTAVTATKTYDGNTGSDGNPTVLTLATGDEALTPAFQVYDNADYGTTHVLTASGLTIKNVSGTNVTNNYTINYVPSPATGVINKLVVTVTAVTDTKAYDGNTSSIVNPTVLTLASGDEALTAAFQVYDNADYGTTHVLTASGLTIKNGSGANVTNNYTINYVASPATGVINKLVVTVTAVTTTKTYDGNTSSDGVPTVVSLLAGDAAITPAIQVYDNADYGTTHVLIASGLTIKNGSDVNVTNNYAINYVPSPATGVINKLAVTVTAVTDSKTYDGNTGSTGVPIVVSLLPGDAALTPAIQSFDNANYGTNHILNATGLTIKNASGVNVTNNYAINYVPSPASGVINKLVITVTAVTATKTYDGNTSSDGNPTVLTLATGDAALTPAFQVYDNSDYGTTHVLTASGLTIKNVSGTNVTNNYTINYVPSPATGVINKLVVTVTAVTDTKTYDGNTGSTGVPTVVSLLPGDAALTSAFQVYDNADYGTTHVLTASGLTIKNASDVNVTSNYTINYVPSPATGVINRLAVTVTAVTDSKTYDGNTGSTGIPTVVSLLPGDAAITPAIQVYDNAGYGTTHVLTASGLTIKNGSDVNVTNNYAINYVASPATGVINRLAVTVTAVTDTKTYDGNTVSTGIPTVVSLLAGDVALTPAFQVYDNADYGTTHVLTASGLTIKNAVGTNVTDNYAINYVPSPASGVINKLVVTVTAVTATKTYDGNTGSVGTPTVLTLATGDAALTPAFQVYDNADYGTTHVLTASGLTIKNGSGTNVTNNYTINYVPSPSSGVINKLDVTVTAVTDSKIYDATVNSVGKPVVGLLVTGDGVDVAPIQKFDNVSVGNSHVLIASGLTLKKIITGDNVTANYNIIYVNSLNDGVILGKSTTAELPTITISKVYDGTTTAVVVPGNINGIDVADIPNVRLNATASYDNATIGTGKTITVKYTLSGSMADTYAVPADYIIHTGEITGKLLTASTPIFTSEKVYDGTTSLDVTPGVLFGVETTDADKVILNASAVFDNARVGTGKTITVSYTLSGSSAINYAVPPGYTVTNGVITGKPLAVVSLKLTTGKVYDGTADAIFSVGTLSGVEAIDTDNVLLSGTATYDNANTGINKIISVAFTITGTASGNYLAPANYTITNGEITAKPLTINDPVVVTDKMFDGNTGAVITTTGNLAGVETVDATTVGVTALANYNSSSVGTNKTITVVYTLNGASMTNYIAPADFIIAGAKISDNVTLNPTITSTSGCEGSYLDLEYNILTGTPTQYKITFGASALAAGIQNIGYTDLPSLAFSGVLPVTIPKGTKDGVYQGTLVMRNELGIETVEYAFQFTINVSSDLIIPKFDDVVLCDNSSNNFVDYQWYKNGVIIDGATKQFYNDLDGLVGSYSLKVTTTDGQTLYTCAKELNIVLTQKISVYPSPLKVSEPCTVKMSGTTIAELVGAQLSVYSLQGVQIYHSDKVERLNTVYLPAVSGIYLGNVTTAKGQVFPFKIIVEK